MSRLLTIVRIKSYAYASTMLILCYNLFCLRPHFNWSGFCFFDTYWLPITISHSSYLLTKLLSVSRKALRHVLKNVLRLCWHVKCLGTNLIFQNTSTCKFSWKPLQGRPSPLRSSLQTLSKMSKPKSKIKKVSHPINNVWSSPESSLKMVVHCRIITSKRVCFQNNFTHHYI